MYQQGNMTNAVDAALERVRGELANLERALAVLKGSIDESEVSVRRQTVDPESIDTWSVEATDRSNLRGLGRVLSKELLLPEYGAIQPPDERA